MLLCNKSVQILQGRVQISVMKKHNQDGFITEMVILIVLLVAAIIFVFLRVKNAQ